MKYNPLFDEEVDVMEDTITTNNLIVYNDEVNTFEHVINTLIEVCKHTVEQAEQCTWLIHYKGKCAVKSGSFEELVDMKFSINRRGINAEIE